jgi:hypothetical protein
VGSRSVEAFLVVYHRRYDRGHSGAVSDSPGGSADALIAEKEATGADWSESEPWGDEESGDRGEKDSWGKSAQEGEGSCILRRVFGERSCGGIPVRMCDLDVGDISVGISRVRSMSGFGDSGLCSGYDMFDFHR